MANFKDKLKKVGRKILTVDSKVQKVTIPLVSTVASAYAGPLAGIAVTAAARPAQRYATSSALRAQGVRGHDNSTQTRAIVNRTTLYALGGVAVGTAASLAFGGSALTGLSGTLGAGSLSSAGTALAGGKIITDYGQGASKSGLDQTDAARLFHFGDRAYQKFQTEKDKMEKDAAGGGGGSGEGSNSGHGGTTDMPGSGKSGGSFLPLAVAAVALFAVLS